MKRPNKNIKVRLMVLMAAMVALATGCQRDHAGVDSVKKEKVAPSGAPYSVGPKTEPGVKGPESVPPVESRTATEKENIKLTLPIKKN